MSIDFWLFAFSLGGLNSINPSFLLLSGFWKEIPLFAYTSIDLSSEILHLNEGCKDGIDDEVEFLTLEILVDKSRIQDLSRLGETQIFLAVKSYF